MATLATASATTTARFTLIAGAGLRKHISRLPTSVGEGTGEGRREVLELSGQATFV
jgi:hypothetical protein